MLIRILKKTNHKCEYKINRDDNTVEVILLDTKTFLVHDISHYVVEKNLKYSKGFWGMLSKGYAFEELFGKENELTTELRYIEKIVGPIQSVYMGHFKKSHFAMMTSHIDHGITMEMLETCITEIGAIVEEWRQLSVGGYFQLKWPHV